MSSTAAQTEATARHTRATGADLGFYKEGGAQDYIEQMHMISACSAWKYFEF